MHILDTVMLVFAFSFLSLIYPWLGISKLPSMGLVLQTVFGIS